MDAEYYAGKWNGHDIVVVIDTMNTNTVQLRFDGEVIAKEKSLFKLDNGMAAEVPGKPDFSVQTISDGETYYCIVGKPLKTYYDKTTKAHTAEYNGHKLEGNTKKLNYNFLIDGEEVDKKGGVLSTFAILGSSADEDGKRMMAVFTSKSFKDVCQFYGDAENVRMYPCIKQGGELIPKNKSDDDDDFIFGYMLGSSTRFTM